MGNWKAYRSGNKDWELYDLSKDIEENVNLAFEQPAVLSRLIAHAETAHQPLQPGRIYQQELIQKDRLQSPAVQERARK